ncbi:hypothetical protein [Bacillus benzoevorans]|uniref:Uncharacterized protein n=1 Tax=Bacillus benzoevorans TaxID=1456 RepID=A0A7X0HTR9_9BACI|nr:hypothetical protein [Bacillus benzoevorans]MBB6446719.1 hypothetical protein [Bacillus benzoevorans]
MNSETEGKIRHIIKDINNNGLNWKMGKGIEHLKKRIKRHHIPEDFTMEAYERLIIDIINYKENEIYLYYLKGYEQNYYVFANPEIKWLVIIGENTVMESAFKIDKKPYHVYLSESRGFTYLGTVKEVLEHES